MASYAVVVTSCAAEMMAQMEIERRLVFAVVVVADLVGPVD